MSKASKNGSGSGGDERYMHNRRYKSASIPSKASSSDVSLPEKLVESESSSRSKNSGSAIKQYPGVSKSNTIKSKLRSPVKSGLGQPANRVNKPNCVSANKEIKKPITLAKSKSQMTKMKQEAENLERKQKLVNSPIENKELTEQVETIKQVSDTNHTDEQPLVQHENGSTNGLNGNNFNLEENSSENRAKQNGQLEQNGNSEIEVIDKEEEFNLQLDAEESNVKFEEVPKGSSESSKDDSQSQSKTSIEESSLEILQVDSESCSVDVVESTTSEMSEAIESIAPSDIKDKDIEDQDPNADAVSYNAPIMLKDVKIKLNDCLKDNKGEEENNADQSLSEYAHKESTFGKTLRTISGRNSIGRMRHITVRDRQPSPNSSLFVNTSSVSFSEDGTPALRYRTTLLELNSNNGTPVDKKRKLLEESSSAQKKPKTEEGSGLLNSSFELLKYPFGLQRPAKVSTPYKFQFDKHNISTSEEVKADDSGAAKKWCIIM